MFLIIMLLLGLSSAGFFIYQEYTDPARFAPPLPPTRNLDIVYEQHLKIISTANTDFQYMDFLINEWNINLQKIDDGTKLGKLIQISNQATDFILRNMTTHISFIDGDFYQTNGDYLNKTYGVPLDIESRLETDYEFYYDEYEKMKYYTEQMKQSQEEEQATKMLLNVIGAII